jgi:methylmalonyl-CoA epimerase
MGKSSIDHIGIAVENLDEAAKVFSKLLSITESHREKVVNEGVEISVFEVGETRIELLSPIEETSPVAKFLKRRGPGVHHIALRLDELRGHYEELTEQGFSVIGKIRKGGEGRDIFFLDPRETSGVLLEFTTPPSQNSEGE